MPIPLLTFLFYSQHSAVLRIFHSFSSSSRVVRYQMYYYSRLLTSYVERGQFVSVLRPSDSHPAVSRHVQKLLKLLIIPGDPAGRLVILFPSTRATTTTSAHLGKKKKHTSSSAEDVIANQPSNIIRNNKSGTTIGTCKVQQELLSCYIWQ